MSRSVVEKLQMAALLGVSLAVALLVIFMPVPLVDCDVPATWATESGVRSCAVNGGR